MKRAFGSFLWYIPSDLQKIFCFWKRVRAKWACNLVRLLIWMVSRSFFPPEFGRDRSRGLLPLLLDGFIGFFGSIYIKGVEPLQRVVDGSVGFFSHSFRRIDAGFGLAENMGASIWFPYRNLSIDGYSFLPSYRISNS